MMGNGLTVIKMGEEFILIPVQKQFIMENGKKIKRKGKDF